MMPDADEVSGIALIQYHDYIIIYNSMRLSKIWSYDLLRISSDKMRAIEFNSEINNNKILIPANIQLELKYSGNNSVRVIVLFEDSEKSDDLIFLKTIKIPF